MECSSSEKVVHSVVVHTLCGVYIHTESVCATLVNLSVEDRAEVEYCLVVVTLLYIVACVAAGSIVCLIDSIELVPLYLSVCLVACPIVIKVLPLCKNSWVISKPIIVVEVCIIHVENG